MKAPGRCPLDGLMGRGLDSRQPLRQQPTTIGLQALQWIQARAVLASRRGQDPRGGPGRLPANPARVDQTDPVPSRCQLESDTQSNDAAAKDQAVK